MTLLEKMEQNEIPRNDVIYTNLIERLLYADKVHDAIHFYYRVITYSMSKYQPSVNELGLS